MSTGQSTDMDQKLHALDEIYERFAAETAVFRTDAVCSRGCAFCCSAAGRIDTATLEGFRIHRTIAGMPRERRLRVKKALAAEMRKRETGRTPACPFLMKNQECMIYAVRPFACRRIYSLHTCSAQRPPQVSRRYMAQADDTVAAIRRLDDTGYFGHISYILHLLDAPRFREVYLSGGYRPEAIMDFGRSHAIGINRMMTGA